MRLLAWLSEAKNLRKFALWNIIFWFAQHFFVNAWYFLDRRSFVEGAGILYLNNISLAALWLSALAWWQSTRVEERQIEAEEESSS